MIIPFGEWLPDLEPEGNPGLVACTNMAPFPDGYRVIGNVSGGGVTDYPVTTGGSNINGAFYTNYQGTVFAFAGNSTNLLQFVDTSSAWSVVSKSAGAYAPSAAWEFALFGTHVIATSSNIATGSGGDPPQVFDLPGGPTFADLGGSPPHALHIATVRDFVVLGNTYDPTDGAQPTRVRWSALGDHTVWARSAATQADWQDMNSDGGEVMRIVGGEYGLVIHRNQVVHMQYVGPPLLFSFDVLRGIPGTENPGSVVQKANVVYWYSQEGFISYNHDSGEFRRIGAGRVDRTFAAAVGSSPIRGAYDARLRSVLWLATELGVVFGYSLTMDRWFKLQSSEVTPHDIFEGITTDAGTFDNALACAVFFTLAGNRLWGSFNVGQLATAESATLETGESALMEGRRAVVNRVRMRGAQIHSPASNAVTVNTKAHMSATSAPNTFSLFSADGSWTGRAEGRYHAVKYAETGAGLAAQSAIYTGVDVESVAVGGKR